MTEPLILCDLQDGIARITLNDPDRLNALSIAMVEQALDAFRSVEGKARVIVFSGAGRGFCSGLNLATRPKDSEGEGGLVTHFNPFVRCLRDATVPVITKVRGPAVGIGSSLALVGDLVIASETAYFTQAFRNVGLVPDGGAAYTLVRSLGRIRATELMLLGERLPAAKALEWGLVTRVYPDDELDDAVDALAASLAAGPSIALGLARQMIASVGERTFDEQLALEAKNQRICSGSADFAEGIAAFLERRPAHFKGQ